MSNRISYMSSRKVKKISEKGTQNWPKTDPRKNSKKDQLGHYDGANWLRTTHCPAVFCAQNASRESRRIILISCIMVRNHTKPNRPIIDNCVDNCCGLRSHIGNSQPVGLHDRVVLNRGARQNVTWVSIFNETKI